jgi:hypothetical protein
LARSGAQKDWLCVWLGSQEIPQMTLTNRAGASKGNFQATIHTSLPKIEVQLHVLPVINAICSTLLRIY